MAINRRQTGDCAVRGGSVEKMKVKERMFGRLLGRSRGCDGVD